MAEGMTTPERESLLAQLQGVFEPLQAEALVDLAEQVAARRNGGVLRSDFTELKQIVADLAEAQKRTEDRVGDLAEAQRRTENRLEELAEAQKRTENRVGELAEAQTRTEGALQKLARQVGGLSDRMGGDLEDVAALVIDDVSHREFGWEADQLARTELEWEGEANEIDVFGEVRDPSRTERRIWIVAEAKFKLTVGEAERFSRLVEVAKSNLPGEVFPICFCYRAHRAVQQRVRELGLHLVFSNGRMAM